MTSDEWEGRNVEDSWRNLRSNFPIAVRECVRFDVFRERTKSFAIRVIRFVGSLPDSEPYKTIGRQLLHCGTSVGANYRAACRGRSKAEFIAKLGIAEEEADESGYWMEVIIEGELLKEKQVQPLLDEANELTRIFAQSRISATSGEKRNGKSKVYSNRQSAIGNRQ